MRRFCSCVVAALLWFGAALAVAAESPAARTSTPPDNPAPQPQAGAPAAVPANDDECRLATRESAGAESCLSSTDADHDGVDDGQDECPDTTPGVVIDTTGCADPNG